MKKIFGITIIGLIFLAGCSSDGSADPCAQYDSKIGMVTDEGGVNDESFNQGTWEGIEGYCTDNEVGATLIESQEESEYTNNLEQLAKANEVVVAAGVYFDQPVYTVAQEYPDTKFILIDGVPEDKDNNEQELDNVAAYQFDETQAGYLAGYIAASVSETGRIGYIGGEEIEPVQRYGYGYIMGAQAVNPNIIIDYTYSGTFSDAAIGKTTADTMYNKGDDIIFTVAGGTNAGIVDSAITSTENGDPVQVIGVDVDMYDQGLYQDDDGIEQSVILTSSLKNVGTVAYDGIEAALTGTFKGGNNIVGLDDGALGLPETNPNLDSDYPNLINDAEDSLNENYSEIGSLPQTAEELDGEILDTVTIEGNY